MEDKLGKVHVLIRTLLKIHDPRSSGKLYKKRNSKLKTYAQKRT